MRIEAETPDPSSVTISTNPAAEVSSPESTILDSQEALDDSDAKSALKNLRLRNVGRLTIGYLNINSIRNKFDPLKEIVSQNLDILMVGETKIDDSFPKEQFHIEGYADPLRLDRDGEGGGLLVYVKSDITMRQLQSFKFEIDMECICFEINLRGKNGSFSVFTDHHPNHKITFSKILAKQLIITVKNMTMFCCLVILIQWRQISSFVLL